MANLIIHEFISISGGGIFYPQLTGQFIANEGYEQQAQSIISTNISINNGILQVFNNLLSGTTTVKLRINGADSGLSCSIGAGAKGFFPFTGAPVSIAAGDLVNYEIDTSSSETNEAIAITNICLD